MPAGWRPSVLRTSTVRWLLDLTWGGQIYRLAEQPVAAPTGELGATEQYRGGLDFGGEHTDELALWIEAEEPRGISLTLHLDGLVDVPDRIAAGWDLQTARGRLMVWPDGGAARDVVVLLDGVVREPSYGAATEPVALTLAEEDDEADGRIPGPIEIYSADTWPAATGDQDLYGERYPIIFGRPGAGVEWGSAAIVIDANRLLVAGHPVAATTADFLDDFPAPGPRIDNGVALTESADGLGTIVTTNSIGAFVNIITPLVVGDEYYVRWSGAGGLERGGNEIRGAGEVLLWMLQRSGARWDAGRTEAARDLLDQFKIDAVIVADPEERIRALDWVREHLLPILPMSLRTGPEGLYPVVWRWDATAGDEIATIDVDASRAARESAVEYASRADVRNSLALRYRWSAEREIHASRAGVTGDLDELAQDTAFREQSWCRHSFLRYGRRTLEATSDVVAEDGTAQAILTWWARRYALPVRRCSWSVPRDLAYLEPGSVVEVRDSQIGMASVTGLVEAVRWRRRDAVGTVVVLDRPEGDLDR